MPNDTRQPYEGNAKIDSLRQNNAEAAEVSAMCVPNLFCSQITPKGNALCYSSYCNRQVNQSA
jgi:hypothetical protein